MTEFEKMVQGSNFNGLDPEIAEIRNRSFALQQEINKVPVGHAEHLWQQLLASIGEKTLICPPFHCEFGKTISIGAGTFLNMGVTMLDNAPIEIGNNVLIGPSAQFYTASHSLDYRERRAWETHSKPIKIEDDVWIGGNVVINQGVTIGARSVIASGSVVNKDVPPDTLYGGIPAKKIRDLDNQ
ncbi:MULTISPECIES: sugar O-acetyltransferase [Photobacterium]|uniref:Nodulation protein L n=1 Tax=Photobacterium swingsii TaxID=680026 RepID=A0A0J8XY48_9GAMM|nr:sugar O-acetyltransferase [Photobacterium swingsii]KMV30384.1 acetyltransferase [Photobacterium swingsii]PSW24443.1 sugar O-acetyltransferase [Photobacterium swingsii]